MRPKQLGQYEIKVYQDKDSDAVDEYTILVDDEDIFAMSKKPQSHRGGFNQFVGVMSSGHYDKDRWGERIRWEDTPDGVKQAIKNRLEISEDLSEDNTNRLMPPTDQESPHTIDIVWEGGSGTDSGVETWYYEDNTLWVSYTNGETVEYPMGNVVEVR